MSYSDLEIMLNRKQKDSVTAETIMHEVLHAIVEMTGVRRHLKKGREEAVVQSMAAVLTQVLRDNPAFKRLFV